MVLAQLSEFTVFFERIDKKAGKFYDQLKEIEQSQGRDALGMRGVPAQ